MLRMRDYYGSTRCILVKKQLLFSIHCLDLGGIFLELMVSYILVMLYNRYANQHLTSSPTAAQMSLRDNGSPLVTTITCAAFSQHSMTFSITILAGFSANRRTCSKMTDA